jgi:serine/threonine protein kinase
MVYWAPELAILQEKGYTVKNFDWKKCDIWSLGCVLAELLRGGEPLFTSNNSLELISEILRIRECYPHRNDEYLIEPCFSLINLSQSQCQLKNLVEYVPQNQLSISKNQKAVLKNTTTPDLSERCLTLLSKMLAFKPDDRPSCEELLKDEFFQGVSVSSVETICLTGDSFTDINLVEFVISKCRGQ